MSSSNCATCSHFVASAFGLATCSPAEKWNAAPEGSGICRRYPPRYFMPTEESDGYSMFPLTHREQTCGEYVGQHSGIPV